MGVGLGWGGVGAGIWAGRNSDNMEEDLSKGTVLAVGGTGIYESGRKCNFHESGPWMPEEWNRVVWMQTVCLRMASVGRAI